ncbi:MAG: hypothetical protein EA396_11760 [Anaerolineaceae bacterium]|nr:MAG: hypothetical protein EA396_11760 [Anaerolineaceae bacterium]
MSLEGLILSLLVVLVFAVFLLYPFWDSTPQQADTAPDSDSQIAAQITGQRERLQIYYDRVLANLHDLDEDYAIGKLDDAEYRVDRERWVQRGVQALKGLETLDSGQLIAPSDTDAAQIDEIIDYHIEQTINREAAPADAS